MARSIVLAAPGAPTLHPPCFEAGAGVAEGAGADEGAGVGSAVAVQSIEKTPPSGKLTAVTHVPVSVRVHAPPPTLPSPRKTHPPLHASPGDLPVQLSVPSGGGAGMATAGA